MAHTSALPADAIKLGVGEEVYQEWVQREARSTEEKERWKMASGVVGSRPLISWGFILSSNDLLRRPAEMLQASKQ